MFPSRTTPASPLPATGTQLPPLAPSPAVTIHHTGWSTASVMRTTTGAFVAGLGVGTIGTAAMFHMLAALLFPATVIIATGLALALFSRRTVRRLRTGKSRA